MLYILFFNVDGYSDVRPTRAHTMPTTPAPLDRVTATIATSEIPAARCCRIDRLISVARVAETFGRLVVSRLFHRPLGTESGARGERDRERETEREKERFVHPAQGGKGRDPRGGAEWCAVSLPSVRTRKPHVPGFRAAERPASADATAM